MRGSFWLVIALVGVGTFGLRVAPIAVRGRVRTPAFVERLLSHAPAAAMATLAVPAALYVKSGGTYTLSPERMAAAAIALYVALRWRNALLTLVVGMGALWLLLAVR